MGILAQDTFVRPDQSGWGTASDGKTWFHLSGGSTLNIKSNKGTVTGSTANNAMAIGTGTSADQEDLVNVTLSDAGDTGGPALRMNGAGDTYYVARIGTFGGLIEISKFISGSATILDLQSFSYSSGIAYSIRFQVIGSELKTRIWIAGNAEPGTWLSDITDTSISGALRYGLYANPFSAGGVLFDTFTATDTQNVTTLTRTIPASAALQATSTRMMTTAAALQSTATRTIPASAAVQQTGTRTIGSTVALLATTTRTVGSVAALQATNTRTLSASAALSLTSTRSIGVSVALRATNTSTIPAVVSLAAVRVIALLVALSTTTVRTIPCAASISGVSLITPNLTCSIPGGEATCTIPSGEATIFVIPV